MTMDAFGAAVVPGRGAVVRWDAAVLVAGGDEIDALDLIGEIQARVGPAPTSAAVIDLLRTDPRYRSSAVDLAAAVSTPDGLRVFVRGAMQIRTETDELIAGPEPVERDLTGTIALWLGSEDPPPEQGHPALDLRLGVVTGSGLIIHRPTIDGLLGTGPIEQQLPATGQHAIVTPPDPSPAQISPAPQAPADNSGGPAPADGGDPPPPARPATPQPAQIVRPFESIDWSLPAAVETRQPLAILTENSVELEQGLQSEFDQEVLGIRCSRSHFNNPNASYCQVCGISMVHLTHRLEPGIRPTLGFMVFADGATYAVDRPYLIGRSPRPHTESGLTPLATQDATQSVSREHAELRIDDWEVRYVDLGSTNGSFIWNPIGGRWDPVPVNVAVTLESGTTVSVGRMTFVFEGASRSTTTS